MSELPDPPVGFGRIDLEIHLRAARFRAWRAFGVPCAWRLAPDVDWTFSTIYCSVTCTACPGHFEFSLWRGHREDPARGWETRPGADYLGLCPHLLPLLGQDPPEEVRVLTVLELLADE